MRPDDRMTTREFDKISPSKPPREVESELRAQAQRLERAIVGVLLILVFATLLTLGYTIRTLNAVERQTSPEAQERTAALVANLITRVDCANRHNLEDAVNTLLAELAEGRDRARVRLEPAEQCE